MFRARKVRWLDEIRRVVYGGVEKKRGCTYMCVQKTPPFFEDLWPIDWKAWSTFFAAQGL